MEPDMPKLGEWDEWFMNGLLSDTLPGLDPGLPSQQVVLPSTTTEQDLASNEDIRR